jgi:hypothetical protein
MSQSAATEWSIMSILLRALTTSPDSLRQVHFLALANFSILGAGSYAFPSVLLSSLLIYQSIAWHLGVTLPGASAFSTERWFDHELFRNR